MVVSNETTPKLFCCRNLPLGAMEASGLGRQVEKDTCYGGQGSSAETHYHQHDLILATPSCVRWSVSAVLGGMSHTVGHGTLKHV